MLFSHPQVAAFIRANFVAAWESVRPVPVVEIDFGNGRKLKRTLNGNIATYVCAPDGRIVDVIPGLNTPEAYLADLKEALGLWREARADLDRVVPAYHRARRTAPPRPLAVRADVGKADVEGPLKKEAALLAADTDFNRRERRPIIDAILAEHVATPRELTKRIYREALHCDLDDPYLGLATTAFNGAGYEGR